MNSPRRLRVLIIDCDRRVRRAFRELLTAEPDLEVCGAAGSTRAALTRMNAQRPDVALLDVLLPGPEEGLGLALTLHRIGLPVVVLTTATSMREQAQESGAAAFLEKDHNLHLIPQACGQLAICPNDRRLSSPAHGARRISSDLDRQRMIGSSRRRAEDIACRRPDPAATFGHEANRLRVGDSADRSMSCSQSDSITGCAGWLRRGPRRR